MSAAAQLRGGPAAEEARRPGGARRGTARGGAGTAAAAAAGRRAASQLRLLTAASPPPAAAAAPAASLPGLLHSGAGRSGPIGVGGGEVPAPSLRRGPGARLPRHRGGDRGPALSVRSPRTRGPASGPGGLEASGLLGAGSLPGSCRALGAVEPRPPPPDPTPRCPALPRGTSDPHLSCCPAGTMQLFWRLTISCN